MGVTPNTGNFCTATQLTGGSLISLPHDTYYFSYGGNFIVGTTNGTSIATITSGGCTACPGTTTSTTTSTTTIAPTTTSTTTTTTTLDCTLAGTAVEYYSLIDNCITPLLNTETVGVQVFVRLTSTYALTSNVNVYATVTTQYASYGPISNICPNGSTTSNHKYLYTSGNSDEAAVSVVINSISPSSDSTYNYTDCTPLA